MTEKRVRYEFDPADPPPLTDAQRGELARLAEMKDEDIDCSDNPALDDTFRANVIPFRDRHLYRPVKLTLRLDSDLIRWFKSRQAGKRGYRTAINAALRKVVEQERKAGAA